MLILQYFPSLKIEKLRCDMSLQGIRIGEILTPKFGEIEPKIDLLAGKGIAVASGALSNSSPAEESVNNSTRDKTSKRHVRYGQMK